MFKKLLLCLPLLVVPVAEADDLCGATIIASLTLDHDLACVGSGLIVGADGVQLNLDGHAIVGSGAGIGVDLAGRSNVSVFGGTLKNFETGVRTLDSTHVTIKRNVFLENGDGIDLQSGSLGATIMDNEFRDSRARGIMIRGNSIQHVIKDNTFTGNRVGILVFAGVDNVIHSNVVSGSALGGIRINVFATGNLVMKNTMTSNPAGVEFVGSPVGNTISKNTIALNVCGLKGQTEGNTLRQNLFEGNGADSCP